MLRRAMGKKDPKEMNRHREIFTQGAVELGLELASATYIFDLMEKFAGYGFNKSHSVAYALVSYQTAWLKAHYPSAFMAAVLSSDMTNFDKILLFFEDCQNLKLKISVPNINTGQYKFSVNKEGDIIYGLGAIKGVGESAIDSILEARASNGLFKDLLDLCSRVNPRKLTRRAYEALINSGALDVLGNGHRGALMGNLKVAIKAAEQVSKSNMHGQVDLFGSSILSQDGGWMKESACYPVWSENTRLNAEKSSLGLYLTGHPITQYEEEISNIVTCTINKLRAAKGKKYLIAGLISTIRTMQTKRGDRIAFLSLDDKHGRQEVAIFSDVFKVAREFLKKNELMFVEGEVSNDHYSGGLKMRATKVMNLSQTRIFFAKKVQLNINAANGLDAKFMQALECLLKKYNSGSCPIAVKYSTEEFTIDMSFGKKWTVMPQDDLISHLNRLSGSMKAYLCY